ncbi:glycerol-3-phosphate 1-O-acyltransferase PlsY [Oceanicella sp. SM1341]|uniref:glycerol-3-phosphate 1-O-acyltransferase PlsY n=1 Tax=Oceanicella sp. SM1341 TaxID=1548889 RepID=UPI000E48A469|nr:glycerol-3-phosphate 1-O-acyltransferase PlsY [Oceanicella sp. SM1341]
MDAYLPDLAAAPGLVLLALLIGYLCGSIPFGVLSSRLFGLADPRKQGSGNIGATNVLRSGHKGAAAVTLLGDALKGTIPVLVLGALWGPMPAHVAAIGAFLGHLFPVWIGFRGGKGVATYLGILFALSWPAALLACATWLAVAFALRYSSLSALVAAALSPVWLAVVGAQGAVWVGVLLALMIFLSHRGNIARLLRGAEPKIGKRA